MSILSKMGKTFNKGVNSYVSSKISQQKKERREKEKWKKINKRQDEWIRKTIKK